MHERVDSVCEKAGETYADANTGDDLRERSVGMKRLMDCSKVHGLFVQLTFKWKRRNGSAVDESSQSPNARKVWCLEMTNGARNDSSWSIGHFYPASQ